MPKTMFDKILIANRGEIACRVIKTARAMGIKTVAVYSDADQNALHVKLADEAIHIGGSASRESYLLADRVIGAALKTGAQAIHPGYGFLSENAEFCQQCRDNNIVFIGPPIGAITAMGSKSAAKNLMAEAQVPLVPGYHGQDQNAALLKQSANDMGYPVLLKAVAGGGGKGMRQVWSEAEFDQALAAAKRESQSSFGNDDMLVEKYLTQPRHVEVQVFCDQHGNGVYLFERDCSIQRRHQKVIEEAPAPNMPDGLREKMGQTAVRAAQAINYEGAGTVEFLLDCDGAFYFMEMNTRLQVEHPVTELVTGQDLVEWQLRVAAGETLPLSQSELSISGHAFEARIYAEDPDNEFLPETGVLHFLQPPRESAHVRVDTGVVQGDEVSVFYDPMIAKLIVWDENRDRALLRLQQALREYRISGVVTNMQFLERIASHEAFAKAELDTGFIEKNEATLFAKSTINTQQCIALAALYLTLARQPLASNSPWARVDQWRLNASKTDVLSILLLNDEQIVDVALQEFEPNACGRCVCLSFGETVMTISGQLDGNNLSYQIDGHKQTIVAAATPNSISLFTDHGVFKFKAAEVDCGDDIATTNAGFSAPMNGTIIGVLVGLNDTVKAGDTIMIMEAMKMEHAIRAPADGRVKEIFFAEGDLVEGGAELLVFEAASEG